MKIRIILLFIILMAQIGLVILFNRGTPELATYATDEPLLKFSPSAVETVEISGPENARILLKKENDRWRIPQYQNAPADNKEVQAFLEKLAGLKKTFPEATTEEAARRFKVAPDNYERYIVLKSGGKDLARLYVGTSPSFRRVDVRLPESNDILAVNFSIVDAGIQPEDWLDREMLKLDPDKIDKVTLKKLTIIRKDKALVLSDLAAGEKSNERAVKNVALRLAGLRIRSIVADEKAMENGVGEEVLQCAVTMDSGKSRTYRFSKPQEQDDYVLKTSDHPYLFTLEEYQVKPLLDITRESLVNPADAGEEKQESTEER